MNVPGYTAGTSAVARSPISLSDFETLKQSALFGEDDIAALRRSLPILKGEVEAILDVWYGFVGQNPHLLASFSGHTDGKPLADYLGAVRKRFGLWIMDTARAEYDQTWLDYQHEIGLRHHRTKKNRTEGASSTPIVPFRDLFALIFPITFTLRPFLAKTGLPQSEVEAMAQAWVKSCLLQVTLWSHPYVKDGDF
jgi:hypothetical protein